MEKRDESTKSSERTASETSHVFQSNAELYAIGKSLRTACPRSAHAEWKPAKNRPDVLEPYAGKSTHANHGQRVVVGCQLMQSASDVFLGWTEGQRGRHFYVRQLKDMKVSSVVDVFTPRDMVQYAEFCGRTLARAHVRSGAPAKISGYMGKTDAFDEAIADFSVAYADQSERDHEILVKAVRAGKLEVATAA